MKLCHGIVDYGLVDFMNVLRGSREQACSGDIIDLPRDPRGIVMDKELGLGLEDFVSAPGFCDPVIDILESLILRIWSEEESESNAVKEIGMGRALEDLA